MSKQEPPSRGPAGLILVLLLAVLAGVYSLSNLSRATKWIEHTDEVRIAMGRLRSTVLDAETGSRGYLITGDRAFLEPRERALGTWRPELSALRALTADNPEQQARLDRLDRVIGERMALLARSQAEFEAGSRGQALAATMREGRDRMQAARTLIAEMEDEEVRLDTLRQRVADHRWRVTIAIFASVGIAFAAAGQLTRRQRQKAEDHRRRAEQARALTAAQLESEAESRRAAEESARFAEMFVGMLGHDLRNPLNAVIMSARLLQRKGSIDGKALERILSSAQRMTNMVSQLLDLTRSRMAGGIVIDRALLDLGGLASEVVDELRRTNPGREIVWEAPIAVRVWGDQHRLAQVLSNLLGNAVEHGDPARPVRLALSVRADDVLLTVRNEGPPIPSELLPTIFDPFRRKTARSERAQGLGLGLYIVQQIVAAHGGRIEVSSSLEAGTTFKLTFSRLAAGELAPSDGHLVA